MYPPRQRRSPRYAHVPSNADALPGTRLGDALEARSGRCIALVDARFMAWLSHNDSNNTVMDPSVDWLRQLRRVLADAGVGADVVRVYWYTDKAPNALLDDVIVRLVADTQADGGASAARTLAGDLMQLAHNQSCEHILLASDDERLWTVVDQVQLRGLAVHVVCDDSANDYPQLMREDPSWARLLAQADRRVLWAGQSMSGRRASASAVDAEADRDAIMKNIEAWWTEESEEQQMDLRDELNFARSIPQEVDRQLLLRLSRALGHPLTWPEKKIMREGIRRIVLGESYTPYHPGHAGEEGATAAATSNASSDESATAQAADGLPETAAKDAQA